MNTAINFTCVDDDKTHNMLCEFMLKHSSPDSTVRTFDEPEKALQFFLSSEFYSSDQKKVIFLDINMPNLSGWEVIAQVSKAIEKKENLFIYMLSSSIDQRDKAQAQKSDLVTGYIEKPMTLEGISKIVDELALEKL